MKVCFVSHFKTSLITGDLGTKLVARYLSWEISKFCEVELIDVRDVHSWSNIRKINPQIIHFILSPSIIGLLISKIFGILFQESKIIISAPNPSISFNNRFIRMLRPDLVLIQSYQSEDNFKKSEFKTSFLPNGVDINKFVPQTIESKKHLRDKYGINKQKFIILHVGPIIKGRNIQLLKNLQNEENQVLVIGRANKDEYLYSFLKAQGFIIITEHIENIEDIYALSDCYIFPTNPKDKGNSIECPLSVLEAMACNLPVITTKFGAIPRIFEGEGDGLFFINNEKDIIKYVESIKNNVIIIKTREKVIPYSWDVIGKSLMNIYLNQT